MFSAGIELVVPFYFYIFSTKFKYILLNYLLKIVFLLKNVALNKIITQYDTGDPNSHN